MNDFYNHGSYPIYGSQSSPILDGQEWDRVSAGFTAVQAAIALLYGSPAFTGTPTVPTPSGSASPYQIVNIAYLTSAVVAATIPGGADGQVIMKVGGSSAWAYPSLPTTVVSGATQTAVAGNHYLMTNGAASTLTFPANPASGDEVWGTFTNGLYSNSFGRNGKTIYGDASDFLVNAGVLLTWKWKYLNNDWKTV